jgi:catechol 2,3-dioxygenase-like lactoylglutathione lyase family enzyme
VKPICDHIGLFTADAEKMQEFYMQALGFEFGSETILSGPVVADIFGIAADCRFIKLQKDGFMIEIFEPLSLRLQKQITSRIGINHWGYCVTERDIMLEKLRKQNVPIIEIKRNGRIVYFLLDPDGNRIELREGRE